MELGRLYRPSLVLSWAIFAQTSVRSDCLHLQAVFGFQGFFVVVVTRSLVVGASVVGASVIGLFVGSGTAELFTNPSNMKHETAKAVSIVSRISE
jgi:hypothetical protein